MPTAVIWGGPEIFVERGTMINITCTINYSTEPPAYIFWYHQDEVLVEESPISTNLKGFPNEIEISLSFVGNKFRFGSRWCFCNY